MTTTSAKFWGNLSKDKLVKLKDVKVKPLPPKIKKVSTIDYFEEEDEEFDTVSLGNLNEQEYEPEYDYASPTNPDDKFDSSD